MKNLYTFSDSRGKHNEILKVIAVITMVVDHLGYLFFPELTWMRIIGRIAFPIFAYQMSIGYFHTSNKNKYMLRMWIFALIAQIPYTLLFETFDLNILFTLLLSLFLIDRLKAKDWTWIFPYILICTLPYINSDIPNFDYGWYGILTPLLFYFLMKRKLILLFAQITLTVSYLTINELSIGAWYIQIFGILGVLIALYFPIGRWKISMNKYFFYWFYPGHLFVLLLIKFIIIWIYFSSK